MAMTNSDKLLAARIMIKNEIQRKGGKVAEYEAMDITKAAKAYLSTDEGTAFIAKIQALMNKRYAHSEQKQ